MGTNSAELLHLIWQLQSLVFLEHGQTNVSSTQRYDGCLTCECEHLTNFALLLDVSQTRRNRHLAIGDLSGNTLALSVVTRIGCGISIFGLALTVINYLYFN